MSYKRKLNIAVALVGMFCPTILVLLVWVASFGGFTLTDAFTWPVFHGDVEIGRQENPVFLCVSGVAAVIGVIRFFVVLACEEHEL